MVEQKTGVVSSLVSGTGALIVLTIVVLVIVSTLLGANLLRSTATTTSSTDTNVYINDTTYTLSNFDADYRSFTITSVINASNGAVVTSGNWTFVSAAGTITNATATNWNDVNISYSYITPTTYETTTSALGTNFTAGIDNVSSKIPTILLIGAVVLLFGVIVLLIRQTDLMGIGKQGGSL